MKRFSYKKKMVLSLTFWALSSASFSSRTLSSASFTRRASSASSACALSASSYKKAE
jgi:hypothetical protein